MTLKDKIQTVTVAGAGEVEAFLELDVKKALKEFRKQIQCKDHIELFYEVFGDFEDGN